MKELLDLKKVFSNLDPERQGRGIIMGVTAYFPLGPFTPYRPILCTLLHTTVRAFDRTIKV